MEALSSVHTILGIVHDILSAAETASRNKSRCKKVAERVRCIKDILEQAAAARDDDDEDAATRRLLRRLKKALRRALQEVRRCQRSGNLLVRSVSAIVAGGRTAADPLDAVEADIDRCVIDLTLAYSLRIVARGKDGEKRNKLGSTESVVPDDDKMMDTIATTAIGVPVCTATAAVVHGHRHEMVPPPSCYGYYGHCCSCWSYHYHSYYYWQNHGCACDNAGGGPSYASFYHHNQYSSYHPSMFSDYDPNCSMM